MRRAATAVLAVAVLAVVAAPAAHADGDPASDVLLAQDAFYPYAPKTDARLRRALDAVLERARRAGFPVKVAMIAGPRDLGAYPQLFGRANDYATLLGRELPANRHGPSLTAPRILVVMPSGFGGVDLGDRVDEALGRVRIPDGAGPDALAVAALGAVPRLATLAGHPVPTPPEASLRPVARSSGGGGGPSPLVFIAPVVLVFAGLAIAARRRGTDPT